MSFFYEYAKINPICMGTHKQQIFIHDWEGADPGTYAKGRHFKKSINIDHHSFPTISYQV